MKERISILLIFLLLILSSCMKGAGSNEKTDITPEEIRWLDNNINSIVFTPDPAFLPFEAFDGRGNFIGIGADFLSEFEKRLSVKFKTRQLKDWSAVLKQLESGDSSGVMAITKTQERSKYLDFSEPYINVPVVILSREELKPLKQLNRALSYKTGMTTGYAYFNAVKDQYNYLNYVDFDTDIEGIKQLAYGNIDLLVINIASASYYITEYGLTNLKVSEETDYSFKLTVGINRNMPELLSIFNKILSAMPENEKKQIIDKWISLGQPWYEKYPKLFIFIIVDIIVLFIAFFSFFLVMIINRTLKKRVEAQTEELLKTEEFLKELLEIIPDPVFVKNSKHQYILVNKAFTEILDKKPEELIGKTEFDIFSEKDAERFIVSDLAVLNKNTILTYEDTHRTKEGKILNLIAKKTALTRYSGEKNIVTILHDITELREKEKELMQAQKLETIGRLSGGFAHDFNNILGGIIGPIELIEYEINSEDEIPVKEIMEYTALAKKSSERAKKIIQQLLSLSRKNQKKFEPVEVKKAVQNVIDIASYSFDKQVEIKTITTNSPYYIIGDYSMLEQALLNILINACHSMTIMRSDKREWGGTITIEISEKNIAKEEEKTETGSLAPGKYCIVRISDTGIGMDKKTRELIFEPFYSTKKGEGSGLGLTMVINIVNSFSGSIKLESEKGKGTEFTLFFPVIKIKPDNEESFSNSIIRGSGNIVIIDDEESIRSTSSTMLELCGYKTKAFSNGKDALEYITKNSESVDMVLLDFIMPGLSAQNTYRGIKEINPEIAVILISGSSNDERIKPLLDAGIDSFIPKPFTLQALSEETAKILFRKK